MAQDRFVAATKKLMVGDPTKTETQLGPMVSAGQRASVEEFLADARRSAASSPVGVGGHIPRVYLEPTVLSQVGKTDRCWRDETRARRLHPV
jgi:acyl-CoA reductase-like NAD-dependent aldehyde dehydrogenase